MGNTEILKTHCKDDLKELWNHFRNAKDKTLRKNIMLNIKGVEARILRIQR